MNKQRRNDAIKADKELVHVLDELLSRDVKITVRECVRRMKLVNAPSSITRSKSRMEIVNKYIEKQEHVRSISRTVVRLSTKQLEVKIQSLESTVKAMQKRESGLLQTLDALFVAALSKGVDVSSLYFNFKNEREKTG